MKNFFVLIISYILLTKIKSKIIYQCARYGSMPDQCLNKWVDLYNNIYIDLWTCPLNKYCHVLEKNVDRENTIGVCLYNYKKLYDNDECTKDSECASLNCENNICVGFDEGDFCSPNLFQCKDNLACKRSKEIQPYGEEKDIFTCQKVSQINETCENNNECDVKLVCVEAKIYDIINLMHRYNIDDITKLNQNISFDEYLSFKNNTQKICINRASLENGLPSSEPMACISGDTIDIELFPNYNESICVSRTEITKECDITNTCMININLGKYNKTNITQECMLSSMGNPFCPFDQRETAWKNYLEIFEKYARLNGTSKIFNKIIFHFPVYKDTLNIFEISEAFWSYKLWNQYIEADYCAKQYFFLKNSHYKIKYNYKYLIYIILYLLI